MFYGIVVLMYYRDNRQHQIPHIDARYQDDEVVIDSSQGKY